MERSYCFPEQSYPINAMNYPASFLLLHEALRSVKIFFQIHLILSFSENDKSRPDQMENHTQSISSHRNTACMDFLSMLSPEFHLSNFSGASTINNQPLVEWGHLIVLPSNTKMQTLFQSTANQWNQLITPAHDACL